MEESTFAMMFLFSARSVARSISRLILLFFTVLAPLKFGLPYAYNIESAVPGDLTSLIFETWPAEWGMMALVISTLLYIFSWCPKEEPYEPRLGIIDMGITLLFIGVMVNVLFHGVKTGGIQTVALLGSYGLYFFLLRGLFPGFRGKNSVFAWSMAAFVLIVLYGFYQHFEGLDLTLAYAKKAGMPGLDNSKLMGRIEGKKIFSTFIYSNSLGGYLVMSCPLFIGAFFVQRTRRSMILVSLMSFIIFLIILLFILGHRDYLVTYCGAFLTLPLSSLFLIILTRSKGALLSLGIALLPVPFMYAKKYVGCKRALLLSFVIGVILLSAGAHLWKRLPGSFRVRRDYAASSASLIVEKPIVGHGLGTFGVHYMRVMQEGAEEVQMAHNDFLQLWVEGGLLCCLSGLFLFLCPARVLWKHLKKAKVWGIALFISISASFFHHLVDFDLFVPGVGYPTMVVLHLMPSDRKTLIMRLSVRYWNVLRIVAGILCILSVLLLVNLHGCLSAMEKGRIHKEMGQFGASIEAYQYAMERFAYLPVVHVRLAEVLMMTGHFDNAETAWENALSVSPENAVTWFRYAMCLATNEKLSGKDRSDEIMMALNNAVYHYPPERNISSFSSEVP